MPTSSPTSPFTGSLLDGVEPIAPAPPAPEAVTPPTPRKPSRLAPLWANTRLRYSLLAVLLISGALTAYFLLRPVPQPNYAEDPMDEVLNYTLLTDEFNHLPVDQR